MREVHFCAFTSMTPLQDDDMSFIYSTTIRSATLMRDHTSRSSSSEPLSGVCAHLLHHTQ